MSSLESFGSLLDETVAGGKLSASRVERVRDAAVKCMDRGSKVSSIILKVHTRSSDRTRLSSLYLFDAISRYAADIVRKRASGFNYREAMPPSGSRAERGSKDALIESAQEYLRAAAGTVEEIVLSTQRVVREDQKAKVAKVVDIWAKAGTFEEDLLMKIRGQLTIEESALSHGAIKKNDNNSSTTTTSSVHNTQDPRPSDRDAKAPRTSIPSPYSMVVREEPTMAEPNERKEGAAGQIPSSLLALLGSSNSKVGSSQPASKGDVSTAQNGSDNTTTSKAAAFDTSQLAMLQQIAQQNSLRKDEANAPSHSVASFDTAPVNTHTSIAAQRQSILEVASHTANAISEDKTPVQGSGSITFVPNQSVGDLSQFNFALFDPTDAAHWVKFAQHWHNTYQYTPSNQECMWAMMSAIQSQMYMANYDGGSSW